MDIEAGIFIIYMVLGYWATGRTIYRNKILIGTGQAIFMQRLIMGVLLGWILIPIALLVAIFGRKEE
ncbi:MAG: hypothetical protein K2N01_03800 [Lachnospiraceae bacterium]|nr:hypothetical protein [Lachnospiraceae bacterium]